MRALRRTESGSACPKVLVALDKFATTLSSLEASTTVAKELDLRSDLAPFVLPFADGGEGSVQCVLAGGRSWAPASVRTTDCWGRSTTAYLAVDGSTVLAEAASVIGLRHRPKGVPGPSELSSAALGHHVSSLFRRGATKVVLCVGGTATVDGGIGVANALNWRLPGELVVASDVSIKFRDAILFAAQKGASAADIPRLARALDHAALFIHMMTGVEVDRCAYAGGGGGVCGALFSLGAEVRSGFDVVSGIIDLKSRLEGCLAVVTGEGRRDASTYQGKGAGRLEEIARQGGLHVAFVCGSSEALPPARACRGQVRIFELRDGPGGVGASLAAPRIALRYAAQHVADWLEAVLRGSPRFACETGQ